MMIRSTEAEEEVVRLLSTLPPLTSLVSQSHLDSLVGLSPLDYPLLSHLTRKDRRETITLYMNRRYPLWNQQGKSPRGRVWVLMPLSEVACASC